MNQPWVYTCFPSWTPLPPPSTSHPFGSFQCTSLEHPVSCIKPTLAIYFTYGNIHVSMLFSQIIPPSPSPESNSMFFFIYIFIYLFIYFTLQYCSGFSIHWHESAMGVHVSPTLTLPSTPSSSHPSGSFQCTSPEHPVSCIKPGLAICFTYGNIHVSMLFSQIILPSPSPTESHSLFLTCVSLLLPHI